MNLLEADCPGFGLLGFVGPSLHDGYDFFLSSNCDGRQPDFVFFLDSRGIGREFEDSLAQKLIQFAEERRQRYLMVCRPLELTTWATLVNFMHFNKLAPQTLVTNMGFVDFTPKKQIILEDAIQQIEAVMGQDIATFDFAENYVLSNGESVPLYSMKYRDAYKEKIEEIVEKQRTFIINTPLVDADICIERERPNSFFSGVADTSEFNRSIKGACVVDFPKIDESFTYDAVHYTKLGSDLIFRIIKESL